MFVIFDDWVEKAEKGGGGGGAEERNQPQTRKRLRRLEGKGFSPGAPLPTFITQKSAVIFEILLKAGKERAKRTFLVKEPALWKIDDLIPTFLRSCQENEGDLNDGLP